MSLTFSETRQVKYTHDSHKCDTYVKDDIISLFFNAKSYLKLVKNPHESMIMAAGIDDDDDDEIDGILGFGISQKDMQNIIKSTISNDLITVSLSEKIFQEKGKQLIIDIAQDTLPQNVKLDNVAFGDININRVYENIGRLDNRTISPIK